MLIINFHFSNTDKKKTIITCQQANTNQLTRTKQITSACLAAAKQRANKFVFSFVLTKGLIMMQSLITRKLAVPNKTPKKNISSPVNFIALQFIITPWTQQRIQKAFAAAFLFIEKKSFGFRRKSICLIYLLHYYFFLFLATRAFGHINLPF